MPEEEQQTQVVLSVDVSFAGQNYGTFFLRYEAPAGTGPADRRESEAWAWRNVDRATFDAAWATLGEEAWARREKAEAEWKAGQAAMEERRRKAREADA